MSEPVRSETSSSRVRRVIREAEDLFLQEGFLHFSTDDLARRLRCSKRTIYKVAPDRNQFFECIISRHLLRLNENMFAAAEAATDWMSALRAILDAIIRTFGPESTKFVRDIMRFPGGVRLSRETETARIDLLQRVIAAGIAAGTFRKVNPTVAAYAMHGAARRLSEDDFLAGTRITWNEAMAELFKLVSDGLRAEDKPANPRRTARKSSAPRGTFD